ncbi:hypothetical protein KP509_10G030600 [Ceratopteris richardii]|uniref:Uncharacterized protein n=1 Tax=Ceratopteris richardii TaxID=49495 RepID=A0A8T2TW34_CERRI|nr:hypothetical protein KP509_10G030600 [Ceratopteris richardii]
MTKIFDTKFTWSKYGPRNGPPPTKPAILTEFQVSYICIWKRLKTISKSVTYTRSLFSCVPLRKSKERINQLTLKCGRYEFDNLTQARATDASGLEKGSTDCMF